MSLPVRPEGPECRIIHTVLGNLSQADRAAGSAYAISTDDGSLLLPGYKFFPMAVPVLDRAKITSALIQVYAPDREVILKASLALERNGTAISPLSSKPVHSAWNKKASLWNMVEAFALGDFAPGEYDLRIRLADGAGNVRSETTIPVRLKQK